MGLTTIEQANIEVVDGRLSKEKELGPILIEITNRMNKGFYQSKYLDMIVQKYYDRFEIYDAYPFVNVWCMVLQGEVKITELDAGNSPKADKDIDGNNEILSKLIGAKGKFWGGTQDDDGFIEFGGKDFPLEVGFCSATKTMIYLYSQQRIARWPYGSNTIFLMEFLGEVQ